MFSGISSCIIVTLALIETGTAVFGSRIHTSDLLTTDLKLRNAYALEHHSLRRCADSKLEL
jgi:hypothetical protein